MRVAEEERPHGDRAAELLAELARERLGSSLAGLDLAARELPLPRLPRPIGPARDEDRVTPPDHRRDDPDPLHASPEVEREEVAAVREDVHAPTATAGAPETPLPGSKTRSVRPLAASSQRRPPARGDEDPLPRDHRLGRGRAAERRRPERRPVLGGEPVHAGGRRPRRRSRPARARADAPGRLERPERLAGRGLEGDDRAEYAAA